MKIKKPYTISNVEKNRIRGLHESVKNKNLINEQSYMHYSCDTSTCQCVPTSPGTPPNQGYFSLQDCLADTSTCCGSGGGGFGCVNGQCVADPNGPFNTLQDCIGSCGQNHWWCIGGVAGMSCIHAPNQPGPNASGPFNSQADCMQSSNCATPNQWYCEQMPGSTPPCGCIQGVVPPGTQAYTSQQDCQLDQNSCCYIGGLAPWWCLSGVAGPGSCVQAQTNPQPGMATGPYPSQTQCYGDCNPPTQDWKCVNKGSHWKFGKKCVQVQPGQGNFPTKSDCEDAGCGPRRADMEYKKEFATSSTSPKRPSPQYIDRERLNEQIELPKGWRMVSPEELDEENAMDDLYEVWLGHEDNIVLEDNTPYTIKEKIYELPARFGNKRLTETEMINMINSIIK